MVFKKAKTMKRHGNLFSQIADLHNITTAHENAKKGKSHYEDVKEVEKNPEKYLKEIHEMLVNDTFTTSKYRTKTIYEPKKRTIYKLPYFPDRIIHHAIMQIIQPIWDNVFIHDLYSAIPGKGLHAGSLRLRDWLMDEENTKYCLKFDIRGFYPSINQDILMELIQHKIKCSPTLRLLEDIIRSPKDGVGIPIGNYLSQYFGNIYLNEFDHWLKEEKGMRYYLRYCDDGCILHAEKRVLNELLDEIEVFFGERLQLQLNPKTQISPVDVRGVDFLGYRCFRNYTLLRKSSARRLKEKMYLIKKHHQEMPPQHIISSVMSYCGWIKFCDCHHLEETYITGDEKIVAIMDEAAEEMEIQNPLLKLMDVDRGRRKKNAN